MQTSPSLSHFSLLSHPHISSSSQQAVEEKDGIQRDALRTSVSDAAIQEWEGWERLAIDTKAPSLIPV